MTAAQLIERLREFPPDRIVYLDAGYGTGIVSSGTVYTAFLDPDGSRLLPEDYRSLNDTVKDESRFNKPVVMLSL